MASAIDTARAGIEARLGTNWFDTDIAWPGVEFDPGEDDWVRPTIVMSAGVMESYGASGTNTVDGILFLDLFTAARDGYGTLYGYVDTLRDLFDRATVGAVEFLAASGPREIVSTDGWRQLQVECPFIIEETT